MTAARRRTLALALAAGGVSPFAVPPRTAAAQTVVVGDVGPGRPGRLLRNALASRHLTLVRDSQAVLPRDTTYGATVVVVAPSATVASTVHGDVVVVGGDLFLHPGAVIDGQAIAIGGGVYNSTLAVVRGGRQQFPDQTFATDRGDDTLRLDYRRIPSRPREPVQLPGVYGVGLPSYDRVNGVALPFGPRFSLDTARIAIDPLVTYRSHLGAIDPSLAVSAGVGGRTTLALAAGRGTFTNDAWIRPDVLNGVITLLAARDTRNYYRADRAELRLARVWETEGAELEPFVAALTEHAWSSGSRDPSPEHVAWSIVNRHDTLGMARPNPAVRRGRTSSAVVGSRLRYAKAGLLGNLVLAAELPVESPGDERYVQTTLDGDLAFDALADHRLQFFAHAVITAGDLAPPQRFAYLGGNGTIRTRPLLSFGGDQLLFLESRYVIPFSGLSLPLVGSPILTLRHLAGSAGAEDLPPLVQNVGVRLTVSALRVDFVIDPDSRDTNLGLSLAFFR